MATATALSTLNRIGDVADPPTVEKMRHQVRSDGLALFDGAHGIEAMLGVARQMMCITAHPDSDDRGVTTIVELGPAANQPNAGGFSRRELMPHTDRSGVPDPPGLMMLTCAVQAPFGGANRFTDGLAVHDHLAATCPESLQALSRARSALFGGAAGHLGAVFTPRCRPRTGQGRDPAAPRRSCIFLSRRCGMDPAIDRLHQPPHLHRDTATRPGSPVGQPQVAARSRHIRGTPAVVPAAGQPIANPGRRPGRAAGAIGETRSRTYGEALVTGPATRASGPVSGRCVGEVPPRGAERSGGFRGVAPRAQHRCSAKKSRTRRHESSAASGWWSSRAARASGARAGRGLAHEAVPGVGVDP